MEKPLGVDESELFSLAKNSSASLEEEDDRWEDLADAYEAALTPRGKSGGGGKRSHRGSKHKRDEVLQNAREKRKSEAEQELLVQLRNSEVMKLHTKNDEYADIFAQEYAAWVVRSLENGGEPVLKDDDIEFQRFNRASGPGGQNMQKNASAIRATHVFSGITVEANSRSALRSEEEAHEKLVQKLRENVATWRGFLDSSEPGASQDREKAHKAIQEEVKVLASKI